MIAVAGYKYNEDKGWRLAEDSQYDFGGNQSPIELAADVCAWYILEEKILKDDYPGLYESKARNAKLTPETIAWVEKYMIVE